MIMRADSLFTALDVVRSFKIKKGPGPRWVHPVIRNGRLYVRHGDVLMVYRIAR